MTSRLLLLGGGSWFAGKRAELCNAAWGVSSVASLSAAVVSHANYNGSIEPTYMSSVPSECDHVDRLTVTIPAGSGLADYVAVAHVVYPSAMWNGRFLVVHAGHNITAYDGPTGLQAMHSAALTGGFAVVGLCMPFQGWNPASLGGTNLSSHDLSPVVDAGRHPWRYFLEPLVRVVAYLRATFPSATVDATGVSGGGWTLDHACAVDPRIRRSFPVFGSLPFSLRPPGDAGDWEQLPERSWWSIYSRATDGLDHEVAYAMACADVGRRRVQILGTDDPVFPIATVRAEVDAYAAKVTRLVPPGQHAVHVDETTDEHQISTAAVALIMDELAA